VVFPLNNISKEHLYWGSILLWLNQDPLNIRFGQNWKKLTKDLFLNSEGNLKLKTQLWEDITTVILPGLLKHIGYIPIPRIGKLIIIGWNWFLRPTVYRIFMISQSQMYFTNCRVYRLTIGLGHWKSYLGGSKSSSQLSRTWNAQLLQS
jgi:hypothetical protein